MYALESAVLSSIQHARVNSLLIAISGGADSVALLTAVYKVAPRLNLRIEAVNCNFHLRGEESNRDSEFTADLCNSLGIKLHALDYNVEDFLSKHPGMSTEMACRDLRYSDFFRIMKEERLDRVAVAHNSDDDIETMLLNMLRGSGTRGLKAMDLDNGTVIRPLLGISRKEIEEYLNSQGKDYITDSSNLSSSYRRNFLRLEVLPLLESRWPGARKSLATTVGILKEESSIIEDHYRKELERLCPQHNILLIYSEGVSIGTILRFLEPYGGNAVIAKEILDAAGKDFKERTWKLSEDYSAILERDKLLIANPNAQAYEPQFKWIRLEMNPATMAEVKANRDHNTVYLPHDANAYSIRHPKTGDRMSPLGMRGSRLVSDIISDARLERKQKAMIRVLQRNSDGEIIWIPGLKRSRHDLISDTSPYCFKAILLPH